MHDLTRLVGDRRARQLLLTGEPVSAAAAERWGLVNRVVPAEECLPTALALGQSLAESGPIALATTKKQLDEASRRPRDLRGSAAVSAAIRVSEEAAEGMAAFLEKRPPRWANPPAE
jgi:enoyl-CoA hydratase/carnithine racemase